MCTPQPKSLEKTYSSASVALEGQIYIFQELRMSSSSTAHFIKIIGDGLDCASQVGALVLQGHCSGSFLWLIESIIELVRRESEYIEK